MKSISSLRFQSRLFYLLVIASLLIQMGFTTPVRAAAVAAPRASVQSATFTTCADATGIPQSECEVLVALYNSAGGANWTNNTGWLQTNTPCSWFGIECVPDYIYGIELTSNNLTGTIPKELGNLANLEDLELGANNLTGTIPSELGNLANLVVLKLGGNQLNAGEIPSWLSNLVKLRSLMLSGTQRTGEIPSWLFDLDRLEILSLDHNLLEGQIPPEITNLTNLIGLNLAGNHLTGSIPPYLGSLSNLQELDFGGNNFNGIIPTELGLLSNLRVMDLAGNQLTGNFPQELGNLVNLQRLDLSSNQLSGPIPHEIGNLTNLQVIGLSNNQLSGQIPTEIGNLTNLRVLDLPVNQFTGNIPSEIGNLVNLTFLSLERNQLTGKIPVALANLVNLQYLGLGWNQLTGVIPSWLFNLVNLQALRLYGNQLSGPIPPEISNLTNLQELGLGGNQFSGQIPSEIGTMTNLTNLGLSGNQLTGGILPEIGNLVNLQELYLAGNQLNGPILPEISNLTQLQQLDLGWNQFSGEIPPEIGNLSNLTNLNLNFNQLTGSIPPELGNLVNLTGLRLNYNQLTGEIPVALANLVNLQALGLSGNQLSGQIPPEIRNLTNLQELGLSGNQLSGNLPSSIGNLTSLTELYTDSNQLSGEIPSSITNLTGLTILTLSCGLTSSDPLVIAFLDEKLPGWQDRCTPVYNPSIAADVNQDAVALWNWSTGSELTLTIDDPDNGSGIDYTTSMIMEDSTRAFYIENAFDIQVGDIITVTDGITTRQVTVTYVRILGVNLDTNTVYGEADPSDTIGVGAYGSQNCDWQGPDPTADQNGNWVADFTGICNLTSVTTIGASKTDENSGTTRFFLDMPTFTVYPQNNRVDTTKWLVGNEVTLTIDSAANGSVDYTDTKTIDGYHFYTCIDFDLGAFETHPGDLVTITDGITTKSTVVTNLAFVGGNINSDRVWGTADPGTVIRVLHQYDYNIFRNVTADAQGNWMADFSVPGDEPGEEALFDIQPENVMLASQTDEDRDQTQLEWRAPDNQPPVADAGGSYTVYVSGTVTLDASASSDLDGDTLTYEWDLDYDGQYNDASGITATVIFNQVGDHTIGLRVTDDGGLSDTDTATVTVLRWILKGFYQPVDMNGIYNIVKNGSTVPFKFEIFAGPTELTDITYVTGFAYIPVACDSNASVDVIETTVTGGTSLRYDATAGQFVYNWKTPKTAGKCYRVTMTTIDGSSLVAYFKLQ